MLVLIQLLCGLNFYVCICLQETMSCWISLLPVPIARSSWCKHVLYCTFYVCTISSSVLTIDCFVSMCQALLCWPFFSIVLVLCASFDIGIVHLHIYIYTCVCMRNLYWCEKCPCQIIYCAARFVLWTCMFLFFYRVFKHLIRISKANTSSLALHLLFKSMCIYVHMCTHLKSIWKFCAFTPMYFCVLYLQPRPTAKCIWGCPIGRGAGELNCWGILLKYIPSRAIRPFALKLTLSPDNLGSVAVGQRSARGAKMTAFNIEPH